MNLADLSIMELAGTFTGFVITLLIFSYFFGDNALFRLAISVFIGVAAGYAAVVAWYNVIWPQLVLPLLTGSQSERLFAVFPLFFGVLLLAKAFPRISWLGTTPLAYLVGVGVATAIGGAVLGTLFPQAGATINLFGQPTTAALTRRATGLGEAVIILVGTLATLIYFQFGAQPRPNQPPQRSPFVEGIAWVGKIFIAIALGALFAGAYAAALAAFVDRWRFIVDLLLPLFSP